MFESGNSAEDRVARFEANVEHIRSDTSDVKIDIRRLGDKIDNENQKSSSAGCRKRRMLRTIGRPRFAISDGGSNGYFRMHIVESTGARCPGKRRR
jgi:hypothetical protein